MAKLRYNVVTLLPLGGDESHGIYPTKTEAIKVLRRVRRMMPSLLHTIRKVEEGPC